MLSGISYANGPKTNSRNSQTRRTLGKRWSRIVRPQDVRREGAFQRVGRWLTVRHPRRMPAAAPRPCPHPGCGRLVRDGKTYCAPHRAQRQRAQDAKRGSAHQRGYASPWRKARAAFLRAHPLCTACEARGVTTAATVVDHVVPHQGDYGRFWDSGNWASLCAHCHNVKTAREDGGFGRPPSKVAEASPGDRGRPAVFAPGN